MDGIINTGYYKTSHNHNKTCKKMDNLKTPTDEGTSIQNTRVTKSHLCRR